MIGALVGFGGRFQSYPLAEIMAWGSVAGSILQFGIQLPAVLRLAGRMRFQIETASSNIRTVIRNFLPGVAGRGVNQVSSYVDAILSSFLPTGAVAALAYVQTIYLLPVSLFGMSISNAELPEMASQTGSVDAVSSALRRRLTAAMGRVAFFIVPSAAVFWALGDSVVALVYQTGRFTRDDVRYVWAVLAAYTIGLLAATLGRLYTSAFWALKDTRTPLRYATLRVGLAAGLGWLLAFPVPRWLAIPPRLGLIGLSAAAGIAAWIEFALLRRAMNRRIGETGLEPSYQAKLWGAAAVSACAAFMVKLWMQGLHPLISGFVVLPVFGLAYFGSAAALGIPEALQLLRTLSGRLRTR
jgi:putative peptidoglycan lipid II flippase